MANNWLTEKAQKERRKSEKRTPLRVISGSCVNQRQNPFVRSNRGSSSSNGPENLGRSVDRKEFEELKKAKATGRVNANVWMKLSRNSRLLFCLLVGLTWRGT